MDKIIKDFSNKFEKIKKLGWVESLETGYGSVGRTFENLLGCNENSLEIPDYNGIEIKTKLSKRNLYITLFSCKPESQFYKDTERIKNNFGYYDKQFKNCKILNNCVFCNKTTVIGNKYIFKLKIDRINKKIFLHVYNLDGKLIDNYSYWDFDTIEEKLYRKLRIIAHVKAISKKINNQQYFKYYKVDMYKIKDFKTFIDLIEDDIIRINFKVGIYRKGKKKGLTYDHGTGFDIKEIDLPKLYTKIKSL